MITMLWMMLLDVTEIESASLKQRVSYREAVIVSKNYQKLDSPYDVYGTPVEVSMNMIAIRLQDVDDLRSSVTYKVTFHKQWEDARLKFDSDIYGNVSVVPLSLLYEPCIECMNCLEEDVVITNEQRMAYISHEGFVETYRNVRMKTSCVGGIDRYPYDKKDCELRFVENQLFEERVILDSNATNEAEVVEGTTEWRLTTKATVVNNRNIVFHFSLTRNNGFHSFMIILPFLLVTTFIVRGLLLSGKASLVEKNAFAGMGIMGLFILLGVALTHLPKGSSVPQMGLLFYVQLCTIILATWLHSPVLSLKKRIAGGAEMDYSETTVTDVVVFLALTFLQYGFSWLAYNLY